MYFTQLNTLRYILTNTHTHTLISLSLSLAHIPPSTRCQHFLLFDLCFCIASGPTAKRLTPHINVLSAPSNLCSHRDVRFTSTSRVLGRSRVKRSKVRPGTQSRWNVVYNGWQQGTIVHCCSVRFAVGVAAPSHTLSSWGRNICQESRSIFYTACLKKHWIYLEYVFNLCLHQYNNLSINLSIEGLDVSLCDITKGFFDNTLSQLFVFALWDHLCL